MIDERLERVVTWLMGEPPRAALLCPRCSAPLPPEAGIRSVTCPYCAATSAPPKVVERQVAVPVPVPEATTPKCPRCGVGLFEARAINLVLDGCGGCGGIWLDNAASERISTHVERDVEVLVARAASNARLHPDRRGQKLPCPICSAPMERVAVAKTVIEIDVCAAHGTWFDAAELTAVMEALATGRSEAEIAEALRSVKPPSGWSFQLVPKG